MDAEGALGFPGPALLMATTLNSYTVPSMTSVTDTFCWSEGTLAALVQVMLNFSFFSIMYAVIGAPPSCDGAFHERST